MFLFVWGVIKGRFKSVGRPQKFGTFFIPFLLQVKITTSYGQSASGVVLYTWLQVHMELEI
jgi:hypothetical protein